MTMILLIAMGSKVGFGLYRFTIDDVTKFFNESEHNDDWNSPLYWLIGFSLSEFLPVIAILLSFWYGLTRRNKVIKSRKFSNPQSSNSERGSFWDEENDTDEDYYSQNPFMGQITNMKGLMPHTRSTEDFKKNRFLNRITSKLSIFSGPQSKNSTVSPSGMVSGRITNRVSTNSIVSI